MAIKDWFKKKKSVVWRDENGTIRCPGDFCEQKECDYTCPIWCLTMGKSLYKLGQIDKAALQFGKAIKLAPDFKDAWVNLGAMCGYINEYRRAKKAYLQAYKLDNNYVNAIIGLITACKDLGEFDEALKYCDKYEKLAGREEAEEYRKQIRINRNFGVTKVEVVDEMNLAEFAANLAKEKGLIKEDRIKEMKNPLLLNKRKEFMENLLQAFMDYEGGDKMVHKWFTWAFLGGVGASRLHREKPTSFMSVNLTEAILKPRGVFAMDEFVTDMIGIGHEGKRYDNLMDTSLLVSGLFAGKLGKMTDGKDDKHDDVITGMCAMYRLGMLYESEL